MDIYKKVVRIGRNSYAVTIPLEIVKSMGLEFGDVLQIKIEKTGVKLTQRCANGNRNQKIQSSD